MVNLSFQEARRYTRGEIGRDTAPLSHHRLQRQRSLRPLRSQGCRCVFCHQFGEDLLRGSGGGWFVSLVAVQLSVEEWTCVAVDRGAFARPLLPPLLRLPRHGGVALFEAWGKSTF